MDPILQGIIISFFGVSLTSTCGIIGYFVVRYMRNIDRGIASLNEKVEKVIVQTTVNKIEIDNGKEEINEVKQSVKNHALEIEDIKLNFLRKGHV